MSFVDKIKSQANIFYDQAKSFTEDNPRISSALGALAGVYVSLKLYNKYQRSKLQFSASNQDLSKIAILITGCGHGIGYDVAMKLNDMGYCVIACNRTEKSTNEFNNNTNFTKHGSFSVQMDVTNLDSINLARDVVSKWLESDKNRILWSVINNAGLIYPMNFEVIPHSWMMKEFNVLLMGPVYVTRAFLPLIYGRTKEGINDRKFGKFIGNGQSNIYSNGGRIVNVSSCVASVGIGGMSRYGSSKIALSYMTNVIRGEYGSSFGIWSSSLELGAFGTNVMNTSDNQLKAMKKYYEEQINNNTISKEEQEIYDTFKVNKYVDISIEAGKDVKAMQSDDLSIVINDIIDATLKQYPKRFYYPGVSIGFNIMANLPLSIMDRLNWSNAEKIAKKLE